MYLPVMLVLCRVEDVEAKYYANGEDAYEMRKYFGAAAGKRRGKGKGRAAASDSGSSSSRNEQQQAVEAGLE